MASTGRACAWRMEPAWRSQRAARPRAGPPSTGIRPEHFRLAAGGEGFPFVVAVVEPTGAETHLFGTVGGTTMRAVFRERLAPRPGEVLRLTVEPSSVHVFDPATELRL